MAKTTFMEGKISCGINRRPNKSNPNRLDGPAKHQANGRKPNRTRNRGRALDRTLVAPRSLPRVPNLLILGASGHVAQALLQRLAVRRGDFDCLVLVDPKDDVLRDPHLDHARLNYEFVQRAVRLPDDTADYHRLLRERRIHVVLDVTDLDSLPVLGATNAAGVSYINTSLNEAERGIAEVVADVHARFDPVSLAPHLLSVGMNPGVVNLWVWHGFQQYGAPTEIIHFEYDTSVPRQGWRPMITWSRQEFLAETVWEPTGQVVNGEPVMCSGNALQHREDLEPIMRPVVNLAKYPHGLLVLHEENVKLGAKLGVSSKFLYALHPRTLAFLEQRWRQRGLLEVSDLLLGDNTSVALDGADTIGVCLDYPDKRVYYLHSLANREVTGTNATCAQVAVGADAALHALRAERLAPGIHFSSDLYDTAFADVAFGALPVEHTVFAKVNGALVRQHHVPHLRPMCENAGEILAA